MGLPYQVGAVLGRRKSEWCSVPHLRHAFGGSKYGAWFASHSRHKLTWMFVNRIPPRDCNLGVKWRHCSRIRLTWSGWEFFKRPNSSWQGSRVTPGSDKCSVDLPVFRTGVRWLLNNIAITRPAALHSLHAGCACIVTKRKKAPFSCERETERRLFLSLAVLFLICFHLLF